jgi:hypothetical protein
LNSRLNFRLCIPTLQFRQTPYLGVHETGSRPIFMSAEQVATRWACSKRHIYRLIEQKQLLAMQEVPSFREFASTKWRRLNGETEAGSGSKTVLHHWGQDGRTSNREQRLSI